MVVGVWLVSWIQVLLMLMFNCYYRYHEERKAKNREKAKKYYENNKEKISQKNKELYQKKKSVQVPPWTF